MNNYNLFSITYILPEAIAWLIKRDINFIVLPYDDATLQLEEPNKSFENFLMSKTKLARNKEQAKCTYKYSFVIKARKINEIDFKNLIVQVDTKDWYAKASSDRNGDIVLFFKKEMDLNLVKLAVF